MFDGRLADIRHDRLLRDDRGSKTGHRDWQRWRLSAWKRRRKDTGERWRFRTRRWWRRRRRGGGIDRFDRDARKIPIEGRVQSPDAFDQGRMRGEAEERTPETIGEKQMTGFFGARRFEFRAFAESTDLLERAGEAPGIAGKLHRGSVGQKFALAADGGLNQSPEQNAYPT